MITSEQRNKLLEMIRSYGVEESIRGMYVGNGNEEGQERQNKFCAQKMQQIENFLVNISAREYPLS